MYKNKSILGVIPSRYASTRLPAKPLADICGKTMVERVYEGCDESKYLDKVIVASDDDRIKSVLDAKNIDCVLTSPDIKTGSDRVLQASKLLAESTGTKYDYIINIQGDEPLIKGEVLDSLIESTLSSEFSVGTLMTKVENAEELSNPNVVKLVTDISGKSLYFSRQAIPYVRDAEMSNWLKLHRFNKHIGIYLYRADILEQFCSWEQSQLEKLESLEQLRLLDNGIGIYCCFTEHKFYSVDTPEDLEHVRAYFNS